jgi:hypothetical protein
LKEKKNILEGQNKKIKKFKRKILIFFFFLKGTPWTMWGEGGSAPDSNAW